MAKYKGVLRFMLAVAMLFSIHSILQAKGTVGEYNSRVGAAGTTFLSPNAGLVLDSTGTVWNLVDDIYGKISTSAAAAKQDREAINVRITTQATLPVAVTNAVTITTGTIQDKAGTSFNLVDDMWVKFSTVPGAGEQGVNVRISTRNQQPIPIYTSAGSTITVGFNGTRQPVYALPGSSITVGTNEAPQPVYMNDQKFIHVSTSMVIYPNLSNSISLNAVATGLHVQVLVGSASLTTSWGGQMFMDAGFQMDKEFSVPTSSAVTVAGQGNGLSLSPGTTVYVTLDGKRKISE